MDSLRIFLYKRSSFLLLYHLIYTLESLSVPVPVPRDDSWLALFIYFFLFYFVQEETRRYIVSPRMEIDNIILTQWEGEERSG